MANTGYTHHLCPFAARASMLGGNCHKVSPQSNVSRTEAIIAHSPPSSIFWGHYRGILVSLPLGGGLRGLGGLMVGLEDLQISFEEPLIHVVCPKYYVVLLLLM
jgi:hypothetical protein